MSRMRSDPLPRGSTLVELTLAAMILAAISALGLVTFRSSLANRRVEMAAAKTAADIRLVQTAARADQRTRKIVFSTAADEYRADEVPDPQRPTRTLVVRLMDPPFRVDLESVDFGGTETLTFNGRGDPSVGGRIVLESGGQRRTLTVGSDIGAVEIQP